MARIKKPVNNPINNRIKIKKTGVMWECICGNIVYGNKAPFECIKCRKIDNFAQVPEELIEEREKDLELQENYNEN